MIFGIGTDIVKIARIETALSDHGLRFAQRILTDEELQEFHRHKQPAKYLAKRFAAKEATAKAFGTGFSNGLSFRHIGVINDNFGKPFLKFDTVAEKILAENNITTHHLSLSDEREYAIAFVVLEQ